MIHDRDQHPVAHPPRGTGGTLTFDCKRDSGDWFKTNNGVLTSGKLEVILSSGTNTSTFDATSSCFESAWGSGSVTLTQAMFDTWTQPVMVQFKVTQPDGNRRKVYLDNVVINTQGPAVTGVTAGNVPSLTALGGNVNGAPSAYGLAPGASMTFTIPVKVTTAPADGSLFFTNFAQATSGTITVGAAATTPYYIAPVPASFMVTKTAVETWVNSANSTVTYRFELWNTGTSNLTFVSISDPFCDAGTLSPRTGDFGGTALEPADGVLQVGEIWRYSCTSIVSSTDGNPDEPDDVPNTVTATFKDSAGVELPPKTASANVKVLHPSIALTVTPEIATILTGGTVSYTYTLDNTGDVAITHPTVTAANCAPVTYSAGDTNYDGILDKTETWTFTCTTSAVMADQTNQAVTGSGNALIFATEVFAAPKAVAINVIDPKMTVVKTAQNNAAGGATGDLITVGYPNSVTYHYALTNTGDVPLSTITALDNKCPTVVADRMGADVIGDTDTDGSFDPGETWQYSCGPVELGADTTNSVQFDATYSVDGLTGTVAATDTAHVDVMRPKLVLTKEASASRARLGGQITYTYLIANTGATSFLWNGFSTPVLTDDKCANVTFKSWLIDRAPLESLDPPIPPDPNNPADLGTPGDVIEYTCTTTLAEGMVVDDRVVNTVTMGKATDTLGSSYTPTPAMASVFVLSPDFSLAKVATTTDQNGSLQTGDNIDGEAGQPVVYTFTIAHTLAATGTFLDGMNALSLKVADPRCDAPPVGVDANTDGVVDGDANANGLLNPGETHTYTCRLASLPSGAPTVNTVTVTGTVVERTQTCTTDDPPACTPAEPNDGLGPITHTDTATVSPFGRVVTVHKKGLNCDVGVPTCDMTLPGTEFIVYSKDPTLPNPGTGSPLTSPTNSATFVTPKLQFNSDYWLVETKAPDGFQLLAQPVKFHLDSKGLALDAASASSLITADGPAFTITITDVPAAELPEAGGEGPWPYLGSGLALLLAAGLYLIRTSGPRVAPRRVAP